jgi:hypothetical protein
MSSTHVPPTFFGSWRPCAQALRSNPRMTLTKRYGWGRRTDDYRPTIGTPRRGRLALRRWVDVLFAGVVGAAAILLLLDWRRHNLHVLVELPLWTLIAGGTCLFALLWRCGESRWGAFTGVRHLAAYPPLWVGSLFGAGIVLLTIGGLGPIRENLLVPNGSGHLIWLGGVVCVVAVALLALASGVSVLVRRPGPNAAGRLDGPQPLQTFVSFVDRPSG